MPKMRKKSQLPQKPCIVCGLPFSWRKKWERDWDEVRYCSDRCRKGAGSPSLPAQQGPLQQEDAPAPVARLVTTRRAP